MTPLFRIERDRSIIEEAKKGKSYSDIAKNYDLTRQRVSQICRKAGIAKKLTIPKSVENA